MRSLAWSNTFKRAFKRTLKKQPEVRKDIEDALKLLVEDPFAPVLETH